MLDTPKFDPRFINCCHAVPNYWFSLGAVENAGLSIKWFRDLFGQQEVSLAALTKRNAFDYLDDQAQHSPPGANGIIFLPYLAGERSPIWDPYARGVLFGLSVTHTRADVVVVATGSKPALPTFDGNAKILTSHEILGKKLPKRENFVIIGGGNLGCELAEYLAEKGKKVSVVEILEQLASDAESNVRKLLAQRLEEKKVGIYTRSQVQKIEGNKATVVDENGEILELRADVVVAAVGASPNLLSLKIIKKMKPAPEIYTIGDCRQPGKIMQAIHDGNRIGWII